MINLLCELFDDGKRQAVNKVMLNLKKPLEPFNADDDVTVLKEYAMVMAPIAKSLDKLQGEEDAYLGVLLPTIAITLRKLDDIKEGLRFCGELVDAIQAAIKRRFSTECSMTLGASLLQRFIPCSDLPGCGNMMPLGYRVFKGKWRNKWRAASNSLPSLLTITAPLLTTVQVMIVQRISLGTSRTQRLRQFPKQHLR